MKELQKNIISISVILLTFEVSYSFTPCPIVTLASNLRVHKSHHVRPLNLASKGRSGVGYEQIGKLDENVCTLSESEIVQLLKQRTKARRARDFQKADELLSNLKSHNVSVNDSTKQWRADGRYFVDFNNKNDSLHVNDDTKSIYNRARKSRPLTDRDEEYIVRKLKERYMAKLNRDFDLADDILDELRFLKNVEVDDAKRTFCVVDPFKLEYTFGGKRINNIHPDILQQIELKVKKRADAKKQKNYELADTLLSDLTEKHGVRVDDAKKEWHFVMKKNNDLEPMKRGENEKKPNRKEKPSKRMSASELIPGVSLVQPSNNKNNYHESSRTKDQIPEGIIIQEDDSSSFDESEKDVKTLNESNLETMTVPDLKELLRRAGLPVSGRKAELIDRLIKKS